jgi:3-isopropylmalate dehydratase small subunit
LALTQFGFRAVISTSYADIFRGNALKNSLLPIVVPEDIHAELFGILGKDPTVEVAIDLASQTLTLPDGRKIEFAVDAFSKGLHAKTERRDRCLRSYALFNAEYDCCQLVVWRKGPRSTILVG